MCSDWFLCYLPRSLHTVSITLAAVLIAGEYLTRGWLYKRHKTYAASSKRGSASNTHHAMALLCKPDMSHIEGDWKGLSTVKPPSALWIRNMLVHQIAEKICARDRESVGSWRKSVKTLPSEFIHNSLPFFFRPVLCTWAGNTFLSNTRAFLNEPELKTWHLLSAGTKQHYTLMKGRISTTESPTPSLSKYLCRSSSPHHLPDCTHALQACSRKRSLAQIVWAQDWGAMTVVDRDVGASGKLCRCEHPDKYKRPCPLPSLITQFSMCSGRDITVISKGDPTYT